MMIQFKKQLASLIVLVFLLFGICLLIGFLSKEEHIQRWMLFGTFFFGFVSLSISLTALLVSIKSYLEVEKEKNKTIQRNAHIFIVNNDGELDLIPLCLMANAFNSKHKYRREIYNQFNDLDDSTKIEVLKQLQLKIDLIQDTNWLDDSLEKVRAFIKKYELGKDILIDKGRVYKNMFKKPWVEFNPEKEFEHIFNDYSREPKIYFKNENAYVEKISFFDYARRYVILKQRNDPDLIAYQGAKPIDQYCLLNNFDNCAPEIASLVCVNIVDTIASFIQEFCKHKIDKSNLLHCTEEHIEYYEDRFLESLIELYNLSKYDKEVVDDCL